MATKSEIKYHFCNEHIENAEYFLKKNHPSYLFNTYYAIKNRKCCYTNCHGTVYYESIGIQIPDSVGELLPKSKIKYEIFNSAKAILMGGSALQRLIVYMKTIIIPTNNGINTDFILRHHAEMLLNKLKIDKDFPLTDKDMNSIINELGLFPDKE